mgnify:CR=1 FL=1
MNFFRFLQRNANSSDDPPERRFFRLTVWAFLGMFVLFGLAGLGAFLLTLEGAEQTQVPDMVEQELVDAVIALQERGLYPQVQLRFHSDPQLRGHVVSQEPEPGAVVRAGRRITLLVSQGSAVEQIEDFVGRSLQDVRAALQALGVGGEGVLFIDGVSYVFDSAPAGTVIAQSPEAGTTISDSTGLDLVVSRGPEVDPFSLPSFLGLDWSDALNVLARENIPFIFSTEDQPTVGQEGVIVSQAPDPGEQVLRDRPVRLTVRSIEDLPEDEQFGIFDRTLPEYAVAVELSAVAVGPEGESSTLFNMVHPGGRLAFPYQLELGSTIVVYRYDTEVIRFVVRDEASDD